MGVLVLAVTPFDVQIMARAKKAELVVKYQDGTLVADRTLHSSGCGNIINQFERVTIARPAVFTLHVWNEVNASLKKSEVRGVVATSGTASVCVRHPDNAVAGVYVGQAYDPVHAGSCKAIISDVTTPVPGSSFCGAGKTVGMTHTDTNNNEKQIDAQCGVHTGVFNGQTVAGQWTTNFSVINQTAPQGFCFDVQWKLPSGC